MTEPRQIAVVRDYEGLLGVMRAQVQALGLNYAILDDITKFTDTYSTKVLGRGDITRSRDQNGKLKRGTQRGLSPTAFDAYVHALCFDLIAVENTEKTAQLKAWLAQKLEKRVGPPSQHTADVLKPILIRISRRHMRKLSRLAAQGRKKIPLWKRRRIARNAGRASALKRAAVRSAGALPPIPKCEITRPANKKESRSPPAAKRGPARRR